MKLLVTWSVALIVAVALGLLLRYNEGMVTITLPPYRFDIAANTALLGLVGGFIGLYLLARTTLHLLQMPASIRNWRQSRQQRFANDALTASLVALQEGRLEQVDALAQRALAFEATAGTAALLAARAAHGRGDIEARERWLHRLDAHPALADAQAMFRAEVALEQGQGEAAIVALDALSAKPAASAQAQRLRLRALELAERWDELLKATVAAVRKAVIDEEKSRTLRRRAYEELFESAVEEPRRVDRIYKSLSRDDREDPVILVCAIEAFAWSGDEQRAKKMIDGLMAKQIEPRLLILFTRLSAVPLGERLGMAEGWLARRPDNSFILATLGRLCLAEGLWGKAESFLKRANELEPSPFTRLALAEMYEALGRGPEASELYRAIALSRPGSADGEGRRALPPMALAADATSSADERPRGAG